MVCTFIVFQRQASKMCHFLEYKFGDICLRFLLEDNDLLTVVDIVSDLHKPQNDNNSQRQVELPRGVQFPIDSPALNTWLYLASADTCNSESCKFAFPSLPQIRSLLCQQLRLHSPQSRKASGDPTTDGGVSDRYVDLRLGDKPYLVALAAQVLADRPLDAVFAIYVSLIISLRQVVEVYEKVMGHRGFAQSDVALDWLRDWQSKQHFFGVDFSTEDCATVNSATKEIVERAAELIISLDEPRNERERQAVQHAETAVRDRNKHGAKFLRHNDFLPRLIERLVRLEELENHFTKSLEQEKIASLKQLAYGASHEINNPLGNIATRSQTLLRGESDSERRRQLAMIVSQAYRAHDMISDMMLFAHPPTLRPETVSLYDLASQAVGDLQALADQQNTRMTLECETDFTDLLADSDHLTMLIKALCQNALEACQSGGNVKVAINQVESAGNVFFRVDVCDDGPRLSESARRHLFDPFYSGREAGRGIGLGLSKAWTIAQLHAGRIDVSERDGGGTLFSVLLPAVAVGTQPL